MNRNYVAWGIFLVTAFFGSGCATYDPVVKGSPASLDPSKPNVAKAAKGDLTLYVEEYATQAKSEAAFDTRLAEEGVLPLLILIQNGAQHEHEVKATDIVLLGKTAVQGLTAEQAASKAERSAVGRALGWSMIVPIISIPVAVVGSAVHTSKVNKQIQQDFVAKRLADGVIAPSKDRSGFVFFDLESGRKDLSGLTLEMTARNMVTGEAVTIVTPLPAATFRPKAETTQKATGEYRW